MSAAALSPEESDELQRLHEKAKSRAHYLVLEVHDSASPSDIQEAFYKLSRKWHPDRFFRRDIGSQDQLIEEVYVAITEAYRTLTDRSLRLAYDRKLRDEAQKKTEPNEPATSSHHQVRLKRPSKTKSENAKISLQALKERAAAKKKKRGLQRTRQLSPAMARVRDQMVARLQKAKAHYRDGKTAYDEGNMVKASGSLQLAVTFDPKNTTYSELFEEVRVLARTSTIRAFVVAAENAESFHNPREALANYRKAVELGSEDAIPHYRLAVLMQVHETDPRGALQHLRDAVKLTPKNIEYRMALGKLYLELGHDLNAKREFQYVLHVDKGHTEAKKALKQIR